MHRRKNTFAGIAAKELIIVKQDYEDVWERFSTFLTERRDILRRTVKYADRRILPKLDKLITITMFKKCFISRSLNIRHIVEVPLLETKDKSLSMTGFVKSWR